jgi:hypothetical protein
MVANQQKLVNLSDEAKKLLELALQRYFLSWPFLRRDFLAARFRAW